MSNDHDTDHATFEDDCYEQQQFPDEMLPDDATAGIPDDDDEGDLFLSDGEADGDALASVGWGTDEDYGCYGGSDE